MSETETIRPPVPWEQYRDAVEMTLRQGERIGACELLLLRWKQHAETLSTVEGFEVRANALAYCISELRQALTGGER